MESAIKKSLALVIAFALIFGACYTGSITAYATNSGTEATNNLDNLKNYKGNTKTFNAYDYYMANPDLQTAIGADGDALLKHYKEYGKKEGRVAKATDTQETKDTTTKKTAKTKVTTRDGGRVWNQKLTGDLIEINGKMPETVETWEQNTPVGMQIKLTVRDKNGSIVCVGVAFDISHTDYTYAYFKTLDIIGNGTVIFEIAGTNEEKTGNLGTPGYGYYETENGIQEAVSYMDTTTY